MGAPHEKDQNRHIWINGKDFKDWFVSTYTKVRMTENQTFCLTCKKPVEILNPELRKTGDIEFILSICLNCNRKLAKITKNYRREK